MATSSEVPRILEMLKSNGKAGSITYTGFGNGTSNIMENITYATRRLLGAAPALYFGEGMYSL